MVPNGNGPRNHPVLAPLELPPLGQAVMAAPLVTKTLLFVSEGDQVNIRTPPGGGGRMLRAFDKQSGQVVWETRREAGTTGTLMTYLYRGQAVPHRPDWRGDAPARIRSVQLAVGGRRAGRARRND